MHITKDIFKFYPVAEPILDWASLARHDLSLWTANRFCNNIKINQHQQFDNVAALNSYGEG